jgi:hypothetical protein
MEEKIQIIHLRTHRRLFPQTGGKETPKIIVFEQFIHRNFQLLSFF